MKTPGNIMAVFNAIFALQKWSKNTTEKSSEATEQVDDDKSTPMAMPFVLINVFSDRFCSSGISAISALYFHEKLYLDPDLSTSMYHAQEFLMYIFSIMDAVIADSFLGHFKTIILMQVVYAAGASVVAVGNIEPLNFSLPIFTIIGLVTMVMASGGIRVNLSVFGADQYKLPGQAAQLSAYFTLQYFVLKCGSVIARFVMPVLRQDVQCFGMADCYPLAFGVTAGITLSGFALLICGNALYVKNPPGGNMLMKICKCIMQGVIGKLKSVMRRSESKADEALRINPIIPYKSHWLDYAEDQFGSKIVSDTKNVLNVLVLYLPLPIYWAVYVQQGSRWVFQAKRMDGDVGFFSIKPDQMIVFNSLMSIAMIPVCNYLLYPLLARFGLKTYLQKMAIGGLLGAIAFIISGLIEIKIQSSLINILWLIPQYSILALADNFLYIANVSFAYAESPPSMKSAMQAFISITIALGNGIVSLISGSKIFESQATELFFFAAVLVVNQIVFAYLASKYKYKNNQT